MQRIRQLIDDGRELNRRTTDLMYDAYHAFLDQTEGIRTPVRSKAQDAKRHTARSGMVAGGLALNGAGAVSSTDLMPVVSDMMIQGLLMFPLVTLCEVPGASTPLTFVVTIMGSILGAIALLKFGGGAIQALLYGSNGRVSAVRVFGLAGIGLFVALNWNQLVPFLAEQMGGSLSSAGLGCAF